MTKLEELWQLPVQTADGVSRRLQDLWREQPVILVFLRHFG